MPASWSIMWVCKYLKESNISVDELSQFNDDQVQEIVKEIKSANPSQTVDLTESVIFKFAEEHNIVKQALHKIDSELLTFGFCRHLSNPVCIKKMVQTYYDDDYKFSNIFYSKPHLVFSSNRKKATIDSNEEEIFDGRSVVLDAPISRAHCNNFEITFQWCPYRGMEGLVVGYLSSNNVNDIAKSVTKWNDLFLNAKNNIICVATNGCAVHYRINFDDIDFDNTDSESRKKCFVVSERITPSFFVQNIWKMSFNFLENLLEIYHSGYKIHSMPLNKMKYVLPVFTLHSERGGDWIEIIKTSVSNNNNNDSSEVKNWLNSIGMSKYCDMFEQNGFRSLFSVKSLALEVNKGDFNDIMGNISTMGDRVSIRAEISKL
eukprot:224579_1